MKMFVISDNADTRTGLRLVGIDGEVASTKEDLKKALDRAVSDRELGILLIAEKLAGQFPDIISDLRLNRKLPLVVEIPDRHGSGRSADFISRYIREAIGIKI